MSFFVKKMFFLVRTWKKKDFIGNICFSSQKFLSFLESLLVGSKRQRNVQKEFKCTI